MKNRAVVGSAAWPLLVLAILIGLSGCGQKGNLYLPDRSESAQSR